MMMLGSVRSIVGGLGVDEWVVAGEQSWRRSCKLFLVGQPFRVAGRDAMKVQQGP